MRNVIWAWRNGATLFGANILNEGWLAFCDSKARLVPREYLGELPVAARHDGLPRGAVCRAIWLKELSPAGRASVAGGFIRR